MGTERCFTMELLEYAVTSVGPRVLSLSLVIPQVAQVLNAVTTDALLRVVERETKAPTPPR